MRWLDRLFNRTIVKLKPNERAIVFLTVKDGLQFDWNQAPGFEQHINTELDRAGFGNRVVVIFLDGIEPLRVLKGAIAERPSSD